MSRQALIILGLILLLGLGLRLGWTLSRPAGDKALRELPDQVEYLSAGRAIAAGDTMSFTDERFAGRIYASRNAGYPLLIAACGGNVRAVRVAQCLLDISTTLAVFLLAWRWLGERRAIVATALVAFNPLLIYFCGLLLTETFYAALLAWAMLLCSRKKLGLVLAGVLLAALAIHVRPSGLPMPVLLAVLCPLAWNYRRKIGLGVVAGAITLLVLLPWGWRNQKLLGHWVFLTTNGGITLYDGVQPQATGASDQTFVQQFPQTRNMDEIQRDQFFGALARQQIQQDPWRIVRLTLTKTARTWSPIPLSRQYGSNPIYVAAGLSFTLPLLLLAAWGGWRSRLGRGERLLLLGPALAITLMHAFSVGSLRYRLPCEPLLAVLAAGVIYTRYPRNGSSTTTSDNPEPGATVA